MMSSSCILRALATLAAAATIQGSTANPVLPPPSPMPPPPPSSPTWPPTSPFQGSADYQVSYSRKATELRVAIKAGTAQCGPNAACPHAQEYDMRVPPTSTREWYRDTIPPPHYVKRGERAPEGENYVLEGDDEDCYSKWCPPYSKAGADVGVEVVFYKLDAVDVPHGHLNFKCWIRMYWTDTRLAWDPALWGNITEVPFLGYSYDAPEASEIWLPVFDAALELGRPFASHLNRSKYDATTPLRQLHVPHSNSTSFPHDGRTSRRTTRSRGSRTRWRRQPPSSALRGRSRSRARATSRFSAVTREAHPAPPLHGRYMAVT